ncbi:aldehyde dehydrogenase family protein [Streptomyces sp. NPDC091406]|uniref:aldehyde dehydrogenase family protein n=1 Tax=unclassified Streptomyces TaxID=2593676 RepID=UPI003800CEE6
METEQEISMAFVAPSKPLMYSAYINGEDVQGPTGQYLYTVTTRAVLEDTFSSLKLKHDLDTGLVAPSAADDRIVGGCAVADEAMLQQALDAAADAAPQWARVPLEDRLDLARRMSELLREHRNVLVDILVAEGQPVSQARFMIDSYPEAGWSRETLEWCAGQMRHQCTVGERDMTLRRVPDGVVCVNPPQNAAAPNALFGATALFAGNTLVVRAPRSLPLGVTYAMREIVAPALEEFGAPPGTLNVLCGPPMLEAWLAHPRVNDIVFIGGSKKGLAFEAEAIAAGKKPVLELAGNDAAVVWRDADLEGAVESLKECFSQSGQICNLPNHVIAHPAIADELLDRLVAAAGKIRPGYPDDPDVVLTPVLMAEGFFENIADALAKGATLVTGGRRLEVDGSPSDTGFFLEPTLLRVDGLTDARAVDAVRNETFFPLLPVIVPESGSDETLLDEMVTFVNGNEYGLRNSLWARDEGVIDRFVQGVTNGGTLKVNDSHSGFLPLMPTHGGTGLTGGVFGEANYLMLRTTHLQGVSVMRRKSES